MSSIMYKNSYDQTFELLIKCIWQFKHGLVETGAKYELTAMQTMMLILLDNPRPMLGFTKLYVCDASNITVLVDSLEQKKLANRFPDNSDRRIRMIKLTLKGQSLRKKLISLMLNNNDLKHLSLSSKDNELFIGLLEKIINK